MALRRVLGLVVVAASLATVNPAGAADLQGRSKTYCDVSGTYSVSAPGISIASASPRVSFHVDLSCQDSPLEGTSGYAGDWKFDGWFNDAGNCLSSSGNGYVTSGSGPNNRIVDIVYSGYAGQQTDPAITTSRTYVALKLTTFFTAQPYWLNWDELQFSVRMSPDGDCATGSMTGGTLAGSGYIANYS